MLFDQEGVSSVSPWVNRLRINLFLALKESGKDYLRLDYCVVTFTLESLMFHSIQSSRHMQRCWLAVSLMSYKEVW